MRRTVFYSWQSDLPSWGNRNVIEDALGRALRAIARDESVGIEPVLDRDTALLGGSPDIAHSILAKIAMADMFVADVSIINGGPGRPTPNPNVLVELGYAVAELGWDNVILVQNTAYGGPEVLPFDLRGRRTVTYHLADTGNRSEARGLLQGRLESLLLASLEIGQSGALPTGPGAPIWWGEWKYEPASTSGGTLFVREVGPTGFLFDLSVYNGAHIGQITAFARILSFDVAYSRVPNGDGQPDGELVFRRSTTSHATVIEIEEAARCLSHGGLRAHFGGAFLRRNEPWFDRGFLNEVEMARLYGLVGEHIDVLRNCTADTGPGDNLESSPVEVVTGGVAGLYTYMESIVLKGKNGEMWVAFIDDDVVRYFTNVVGDRNRLPLTIEEWRSRFREKKVRYCEPVAVVPTLGN